MEDRVNTDILLGRIEGKMDLLLVAFAKHVEDDQKLASRLSSLEAWRSYTAGIAAVVGLIGSAAWEWLKK
jgi:hypothetical protein